MKTLHYDDVDITGFAGIREMILVMDPEVFTSNRPDIVWQGHGQLTYLAHAYFRPGGSTGRHYHQGIDVVSILTRGRVIHQGSAGDGKEFHAGQVMVQRAGQRGFMHDEINPENDITGMVQIWLRPEGDIPEQPTHTLIDLHSGDNSVYDGENTRLSVQLLPNGGRLMLEPGNLGYVYQGGLRSADTDLPRGTLFYSDNTDIMAVSDDTRVVCVTVTGS